MAVIEKECKTHGLVKWYVTKEGKSRCTECAKEAVQRVRRNRKQMAIDYKGGKCERCGYNKYIGALEFHHEDPTVKEFGIGDGNSRSFESMKPELDKCILVCSNCHKEIHGGC